MNTTLVIAEKPAMGRDIAAVIGANTRGNGYLEGNGFIVTHAIGHLVELCAPEEYRAEWKSWQLASLPLIPPDFKYRVNPRTASQFEVVLSLLRQSHVTKVINACDAGREGELIFWLIYNLAEVTHKVERLWISSLTGEAIRAGFNSLAPAEKYYGLRDAAFARQKADWLIGLNSSRAMTLVARNSGGRNIYSLGRVQTPTLCLIARRDREITGFKAVPYFEIETVFTSAQNQSFKARLIDSSGNVVKRFQTESECSAVLTKLKEFSKGQVASLVEKQVKINPPSLFDLTLLQRTANARFGLTASETLEIAQSLYETKKVLSYPRTSSCYLSSDVAQELPKILASAVGDYLKFGEEIANNGYVINKKFVADSKVTDHHAIIPTATKADLNSFTEKERQIYDLVMRRFLSAFFPAGEDSRVDINIKLSSEIFNAKGKTELVKGWRAVEKEEELEKNDKETDDETQVLPKLAEGEFVSSETPLMLSKKTRPPAKFTESSLLQAMETAGKTISSDELREAMKEGGLGTPATRAAIIEKLIERGFIVREKKALRTTPMGIETVAQLESVKSLLASPELTGQWEAALAKVEKGLFPVVQFENSVIDLTKKTVIQIVSGISGANFAESEGAIGCPKCSRENRSGVLRSSKKSEREFLFCSQGKDICGFITQKPTKKKFVEKMLSEKCPKCAGVVVFGTTKAASAPYLRCPLQECDGIIWLEKLKPKK